ELLESRIQPDFAMGVLLHETPASAVAKIVERLKFSRAEMHHVIALVENLPRFSEVQEMSIAGLKRFFRITRFEDHIELARIHSLAAHEDMTNVNYALHKRAQWRDQDISPPPFVTGDDLIAMGFVPGPTFKKILTMVEDEQLEGRLADRREALEFVQTHYK